MDGSNEITLSSIERLNIEHWDGQVRNMTTFVTKNSNIGDSSEDDDLELLKECIPTDLTDEVELSDHKLVALKVSYDPLESDDNDTDRDESASELSSDRDSTEDDTGFGYSDLINAAFQSNSVLTSCGAFSHSDSF